MFFGGFPDDMPGMGGMGGGMGGGRRTRGEVDNSGLYQALEVEKNATTAEIKKAYRKMAMKHHPDKGGDQDTFKKIGKAYTVLSDPDKRARYDQYGEEGIDGDGDAGGDPSDIFDMFFGGGGRRGGGGGSQKKKGKDIVHPLEVTLSQLYAGHTKRLAINREVVDNDHGVTQCRGCDGRGVKVQVVRMGPMIQQMQSACNECGGQGTSYKTKKEREVLEVYVDRGAKDGHKIPFRGKADEKPGYETGDVIFVVQEKEHREFKRKGADLYIDRKISLLEALTGFSISVTHLDGRKLIIKSRPGEIIHPKKKIEESTLWTVYEDTDFPKEVHAKAKTTDVDQLKEACIEKNFSGFCVDSDEGMTHFWNCSRDELLAGKRSNKSSKGKRLYVVPDPELLKESRLMKAVENEGMPTLRNPMLKGHLFINIEIEFPTSISPEGIIGLQKILPPALNDVVDDDTCEHHTIDDLDPIASQKASQGFNSAYDEDEDEGRGAHGHGGQGVQCAQQ